MKQMGLVFFFVFFLAGCAGVEFLTVESIQKDSQVRGLRYRDSAPYLLISTDNRGGLTNKLIYLPDTSTLMSARPYSFLATEKVAMAFFPYFTGVNSEADATDVPEAVIEGMGNFVRRMAPGGEVGGSEAQVNRSEIPTPYLFKIVPQLDGSVAFVGGQASPGWIPPGRNSLEARTIEIVADKDKDTPKPAIPALTGSAEN